MRTLYWVRQMVNLLFCESHSRFEMFVTTIRDNEVHMMTLNEDVLGPHHVSKLDIQYVHEGTVEECKFCRKS